MGRDARSLLRSPPFRGPNGTLFSCLDKPTWLFASNFAKQEAMQPHPCVVPPARCTTRAGVEAGAGCRMGGEGTAGDVHQVETIPAAQGRVENGPRLRQGKGI